MHAQADLFSALTLPRGMRYAENFLDAEEEEALLVHLRTLPFREARYKQWAAKRRVVSYGGRYDFGRNMLLAAEPIPAFLIETRRRAAAWAGVSAETLTHALVAEYRPGTPLGWHRDVPEFSVVVGISLLGRARLKLRPYPPIVMARVRGPSLELEPRSIYMLSGEARWRWQHAISPTKSLRYSLTFRALRE